MIDEEYISLETVALSRKYGIKLIDEMICDGSLVENDRFIDVPSQSVFKRWLREKHHLHVDAGFCVVWRYVIIPMTNKIICNYETSKETYNSYEDAIENGIQEALKLLFNK